MTDFTNKGLFNMHTLLIKDGANVANDDNKHMYGQMMAGASSSPMLSYLLNLNKQNLNDFKSIMFYNESSLALLINQAKATEELLDETTIYLPQKKVNMRAKYLEVIERRRSTRNYVYEMMKLDTFSQILKHAFGLGKRKMTYEDLSVSTRYYPSGGGLYPIDVYLYVNHVSGISQGMYKYQPYSHSLYPCVIDDVHPKTFFIDELIDIENMNFCAFFQYSINKNYVKYGELSLFNTLVELGGMSHNFDLACQAFDFTSCPLAGFNKTTIEKLLYLDGVNEHIIFTNICGKE